MKHLHKAIAAVLFALLFASASQAVMITGGFTGNWYNPATSGQGFQLQILPNGRAVAFWFTYDANGNQVWLIGEDRIEGNTLQLQMSQPVGAKFGPGYDPADVQLVPFGTVNLVFNSCNTGTATWQSSNPDFGSGQMPLKRLSSSAGVNCTGSAVDNNSGASPVQDFRVSLINEGVYPLGSGHADYESRPGNIDFDVEIEDVPVGAYTLLVDGVDRGSINVIDTGDGTEGEVEYSSPQDGDDRLLDFDPLGALIEVADGGTVIFSAVLETTTPNPGNGGGGGGGNGNAPPFGSSETEIDLINVGPDPDASGDAELEQRSDRVEFDVEIEDLDLGTYELWVGGELRGQIEVLPSDDGTEGEIEFRNPVEPGKVLLDFDPTGQWISIEQGGTVFLEVQFPTELGGGDDDDDDDDGGNDDDDEEDDDDDGDDDDEEDDDDDDDDDDEDDDDGDD